MCPGFETVFPSSPLLNASFIIFFLLLFCWRFALLGRCVADGPLGPGRHREELLSSGRVVQVGVPHWWSNDRAELVGIPAEWGLDGSQRVIMLVTKQNSGEYPREILPTKAPHWDGGGI